MSRGISNDLENRSMQFSKLYCMGSEIKINQNIDKKGRFGDRDHRINLVSPRDNTQIS